MLLTDAHRFLARNLYNKCSPSQKLRILTQTDESLAHLMHDSADHIRATCTEWPESAVQGALKRIYQLHEQAIVASKAARSAVEKALDGGRPLFERAVLARLELHQHHDELQQKISEYCGVEHKPVSKTLSKFKRATNMVMTLKSKAKMAKMYDVVVSHLDFQDKALRLVYLLILLSTMANLGIKGNLTYMQPYLESGLGHFAVSLNQLGGAVFRAITVDMLDMSLVTARLGVLIFSILGLAGQEWGMKPLAEGTYRGVLYLLCLSMVVSSFTAQDVRMQSVTSEQVSDVLYTKNVFAVAEEMNLDRQQQTALLGRKDSYGLLPPGEVPGNDLPVVVQTGQDAMTMYGEWMSNFDLMSYASGLEDLEKINSPESQTAAVVMQGLSKTEKVTVYAYEAFRANEMSVAHPIRETMRIKEIGMSGALVGYHAVQYAAGAGVFSAVWPLAAATVTVQLDAEFQESVPGYGFGRNLVLQGLKIMYDSVMDAKVTPMIQKIGKYPTQWAYDAHGKPAVKREILRLATGEEVPQIDGWELDSSGVLVLSQEGQMGRVAVKTLEVLYDKLDVGGWWDRLSAWSEEQRAHTRAVIEEDERTAEERMKQPGIWQSLVNWNNEVRDRARERVRREQEAVYGRSWDE